MGRIVAIDFGLKRMGLALSDELKIIASPLPYLDMSKETEKNIERLLAALAPYAIDELVIGNPLHLDGRTSFLADEVQHFMKQIEQSVPYPVTLWDERLSTVQANRTLKEGNLSRKKRAKLVDSLSAVILLQSFLDSKITCDRF